MTTTMMDTSTIPAATLSMPADLVNKMKPERIQNTFLFLPPDSAHLVSKELRGWSFLDGKQLLLRSYRFGALSEATSFAAFVAGEAENGDHEVDMHLSSQRLILQLTSSQGNLVTEDDLELARKVDREYRIRKRSGED